VKVNTHEAKTNLSRLLDKVAKGEEVIIARSGTPIAKLVPYKEREPRRLGGWKGQIRIAPDFDELPEDLLASFHEERG
jgi:prevent-host-death family protein